MLQNSSAMSNTERQRRFRASHPGYFNKYRFQPNRLTPVAPAELTPPLIQQAAEAKEMNVPVPANET